MLKRMDNVLIVVDDLEAVKAFFLEMNYENFYRLAYLRGPEGIIVALAEQVACGAV